MASSGKKKTTMAKLTRESRLRERRLDKKARKVARKAAALEPDAFSAMPGEDSDGMPVDPGDAMADDAAEGDAPDPSAAVAEVS